jgi:hypothetical protein
MVWTPLKERVDNLPLILAGPILRKTQHNSVTVWVALKESRRVTLKIFDSSYKILFSATQETVQIGKNVHIVAVTAFNRTTFLLAGDNYFYDLYFGNGENLHHPGILNKDGDITNLVYLSYNLPAFTLPTTNIKDLRIIHGSCRKPHGESIDALATVDKMIEEALLKNPQKRPHQLFLTGDQIYADDVADALLFMLRDAADALLGWSEVLPGVKNIQELNPGQRNNLATHTAGLTASLNKFNLIGNTAKSHLFTFGEFLMMYLFAWSDTLWLKADSLPVFTDVISEKHRTKKYKKLFEDEVENLKEFQSTLKEVRRALANIPTYMIFDDHEITDDWYLNMAWCDRIFSKPLGRRILQNGMLAYAICQDWGNKPEDFESGKPGDSLLKAAFTWSLSQGQDVKSEQEISDRLGIPNINEIKNSNPRRLTHKPNALSWHYKVTGRSYEVLVLDTRTWRDFPGKEFDFPGLLSAEACENQIFNNPSHENNRENIEVTFVISPSPVIGVPFLESIQKKAKAVAEKLGTAAWGFDTEAWALQTQAFERFLAKLALRALSNSKGRVVILSGDVHYGYGARMQYSLNGELEITKEITKEINQFEKNYKSTLNQSSLIKKSDSTKSQVVITQFTSSSLRNEVQGMGGSHSLHNKGFIPIEIINHLPKARVIGWNNPEGNYLEVGVLYLAVDDAMQAIPYKVKGSPAVVDLVKEKHWYRQLEITKKPEWSYKIDFLLSKSEEIHKIKYYSPIPPTSIIAPLPGEERTAALEDYLAMAQNHNTYRGIWGDGKEIVGVNNIGEITFEFVDGKAVAVQTLWWRMRSWEGSKLLEPFPLTRCEVSLELDDDC